MTGTKALKALLVSILVSISATADSKATVVEVQVKNFFFDPSTVNILVGDTVRWVNTTTFFHTTTSGTGCTADGIWNASLPSLNSTFSFVFTSVGTYPYFCIPHCGIGMVGTVVVDQVTGIDTGTRLSRSPVLYQNYPNPFNPATTIRFSLPERSHAILAVYDTEGKLVRILLDATLGKGSHTVRWDATDDRGMPVSSGIYFYRLMAGGAVVTKKMVVAR